MNQLLKLNIQFFARQKNALTKYYVGAIPEGSSEEVEWLRLAKWISSVEDDSEEEVEDMAFYDGDGTPEDDVISVKKTYAFEGMFDENDDAMKFIAALEFDIGEKRKIMFKQERTNGDVFQGLATVKEPKVTGGEAQEYATFECSISWDRRPEKTTNNDGGNGGESSGD